jgi:hypothetical protein
MRTIILLLFLTLSCGLRESNNKNEKITKIILDLNKPIEKVKFDNWVNNNIIDSPNDTIAISYESKSTYKIKNEDFGLGKCQYEDKNFEIYSSCAGEWGGFLYFVDKKNRDNIHYLSSTCPLMVDFRDNNYFITETLAHMSGFAQISKLKNPRELPKVVKNKKLDDESSKFDIFKEIILDTIGITANVFYPKNSKNYLIYSQYDTTYLGEVLNKRIISKEILLNHGTWSYGNKTNKIKNGIYISDINHSSTSSNMDTKVSTTEEVKGTIYIKQDTVIIGYLYNKKITKE